MDPGEPKVEELDTTLSKSEEKDFFETKPEVVPTLCTVCDKIGSKICSGCHNIRYCSVECQVKDRPLHKLLRKTFNDFKDRPSTNLVRAVFFPDNGDSPHFIWLEDEGYKTGFEFVKKDMGYALSRVKIFRAGSRLHRSLGYTITLTHASHSSMSSLAPNLIMKKMARHVNAMPDYWRGSFLAVGFGDNATPNDECLPYDLDTTALGPIAALLKAKDYPN